MRRVLLLVAIVCSVVVCASVTAVSAKISSSAVEANEEIELGGPWLGHAKYGQKTRAEATLEVYTKDTREYLYSIENRDDVELWQIGENGAKDVLVGVGEFKVLWPDCPDCSNYKGYAVITKPLIRNTTFEWRFRGDERYPATISEQFTTSVEAQLSKPIVPRKTAQNESVTISGTLKPAHSGVTKLVLYRYSEPQHKWNLYKTVAAKNSPFKGYTKYTFKSKLPVGDWYVMARHNDDDHMRSLSPKSYFTVQPK